MAGWKSKINSSSTMEFELWTNAGPSAFQLQEIMLKSDKVWYSVHISWLSVSLYEFFERPLYV